MAPTLPEVVIFDVAKQFREFSAQAAPYLRNTDITPEKVVEEVWEAMFDADTVDEKLVNVVHELGHHKGVLSNGRPGTFLNLVHDMAFEFYDRVNKHDLYKGRGYLPYNLSFERREMITLRFDPDIDRVQQEWLKQEGLGDSDDCETEYMGKA